MREAHESQTKIVAKALGETSTPKSSFSKTAWAAILEKVGAVGRAVKLAFSFGLESDPLVAAEFLAKLTLQ